MLDIEGESQRAHNHFDGVEPENQEQNDLIARELDELL
jgi:hypothetical protein